MSVEFKDLSPENADLAKSLQELGISDEEILKSLADDTVETKKENQEDKIEKSIDEQIQEKELEIEDLKNKKIEKSDKTILSSDEFGQKIDEIKKSFTDQLSGVNKQVDSKVEGIGTLIKSLTDVVTDLKESNNELKADNDQLKKSIDGSKDVLDKIASMSPGLKSASGAHHVPRFEKSLSPEGKEILSKSMNKTDIISRLNSKMDDNDFIKAHGYDVSNYEVSNRMSELLEKAIIDEFNVELVD